MSLVSYAIQCCYQMNLLHISCYQYVYHNNQIHINNLTIINCCTGVVIASVFDTQFNELSVLDSNEFDLSINKTATVTIDSYSFSYNGVNHC